MEEIFVPALGMAMSEAVLLAWLKEPGDAVEAGEVIAEGQRGLLTTGTLAQRPVVKDGRLSVAWRLTGILNVDHRVWDGLDAAELLSDFGDRIAAYGRYDDDA